MQRTVGPLAGAAALSRVAVVLLFAAGVGPALSASAAAGPQEAVRRDAAAEDGVAAFYRGRTVRVIVGFAPGGGYDLYSRLIARHLGRYLPGRPAVVVENMPGAGSIRAANYVYDAAPRDGTVIANVSGHIAREQILGSPGVRFDLGRMHVLGVPVSDVYLLIVARRTGVRRLQDILGPAGTRVVVGVIPGVTEHAGLIFRDALGANVHVVSGYDGTSTIRLAMERGEVDGTFLTWASARIGSQQKFTSGDWAILAQLSDAPLADLPTPDVPAIPSLGTTERERQLLRFGVAIPSGFAKLYVLAPGVPADRAAALDAAFARVMADPDFLRVAARAQMEVAPIPGGEVRRLVGEFLRIPQDIRAMLPGGARPSR